MEEVKYLFKPFRKVMQDFIVILHHHVTIYDYYTTLNEQNCHQQSPYK